MENIEWLLQWMTTLDAPDPVRLVEAIRAALAEERDEEQDEEAAA